MNKKFKIAFSLSSIALLAGCNLEANPGGTAIMTAVNYEGEQRIVYSIDDDYDTPGYTDPDRGVDIKPRHIAKGDYKPVWSTLQNRLGINLLEHQAAANSGTKKSVDYFRDNWMTKTHADISMGTVYDINNYSVAGNRETILDLKPYIEETKFIQDPDDPKQEIVDPDHKGPLPNFALFLHKNPGVMLSIVTAKHSCPDQGAIYYVPYFDGFDEIDKTMVMRADYVRRLLDDNPTETGFEFSDDIKILGTTGAKYTKHFTPCYIEDGSNAPAYEVTLPNVNDKGELLDPDKPTFSFKKIKTKNIIARQNDIIDRGEASSKKLAEDFKEYLNERYGSPYPFGNNPSDLFLGYKACYDTDELIALMRLVKVSSETLFGKGKSKEMVTMMPRTCDNQRSADLYRWAGQIFGVRGPESRNMYLYINGEQDYGEEYGKYGAVHDARGSKRMLYALNKLRELYQEGLILQDFDSKTATGTSEGKFADETLFSGGSENYAGFMVYDWSRDLNDWNKYSTAKRDKPCDWVTESYQGTTEHGKKGYPYDMRGVVGAIAQWDIDGDKDEKSDENGFMPFTESWTSLKTSALCLNAKLPENQEKLKATFDLIDYIYSPIGMFLYNYGPWEDGYITQLAGENKLRDEDGAQPNKDYIVYQGERFPKLTDKALEEYKEKTGYQRRFIGATIPFGFRKLSVVPYQTMEEKTKHGMDVVNKAIQLETFKHVLIGGNTEQQKKDIKKPFYQICPSAFFLTKGQSSAISSLLDKNTLGSMFTDSSTSNFNIWDALVMGQKTRLGVTLENYLDKMKEWKVEKLETYYQDAFEIMSEPIE